MTDKIIIDDVDVSGCIYYNAEKLANCEMFALGDFKCQGQICLYKQLKRTQNALQDIKTLVTTDYIQNKKQLVQNYDCLDNFMQKIEDKCSEVID